MRLHVQRVISASISVADKRIATIGMGMLVLVGFGKPDSEQIIDKMLVKLLDYRLFADKAGKTNLNIGQTSGALLLVPQFTLYADTARGLRPSYSNAAKPADAKALFSYCVARAQELCNANDILLQQGNFAANMQVELINDGPFTLLLESE